MISYSAYNDEQLLELLKSSDEGAFTELYNRYWEKLYKSSYRKLATRETVLSERPHKVIVSGKNKTTLISSKQ